MYFLEWKLHTVGKSCANKKPYGGFRFKNESLKECGVVCKGKGASGLVYRDDNQNCACCNQPPYLFDCNQCSYYTFSGIQKLRVLIT